MAFLLAYLNDFLNSTLDDKLLAFVSPSSSSIIIKLKKNLFNGLLLKKSIFAVTTGLSNCTSIQPFCKKLIGVLR